MKRSLLFLSLAAVAATAVAAEQKAPVLYGDLAIQNISPNGKWAASEVYGTVVLINLETGEQKTFEGNDLDIYYNLGLGNALSNNGVLCCSTDIDGDGTYYENGEWKKLNLGDTPGISSNANGITPDGSRICGSLGLSAMTYDDITMTVPAVWNRQADGTYGEYILLPHPELDFFGRAPQYITGVAISDDGHTVVGQITDCRGYLTYPIVYKEDSDGKWSYFLPTEALTNPNHVTIPAYPGECPAAPEGKDYMTDEKKAEYEAAYQAWQASGYKQDLFPKVEDYMTEEKKAEYEADTKAYETAKTEWEEKYSAYDEAYWEVVSASPTFEFNQMAISPSGEKIAMTTTYDVDDPNSYFPVTVSNAWVMGTENGDITKYDSQDLSVKAWAGDYLLATAVDPETQCFNGYLLKDGEATSLYDYLCSKGESVKEWVDLNMSHDVEMYDYETEQVVVKKMFASGMPVASSDLSVIASWTYVSWESLYMTESYLFDFRSQGGITSATVGKDAEVAFDADGNLTVGKDVATLAVYDLNGICLKKVTAPGSSVELDAPRGVYIVKATYTDGTESTVKAVK